jgi:Bacterial regulatory proteins, luxR family
LLNKQIASEPSTAERTVKFYRAHLMRSMHAESLAELVRMADQLGIAPDGRVEPVPKDGPDTAPRDS